VRPEEYAVMKPEHVWMVRAGDDDEWASILHRFPVVTRKDLARYGEHRTRWMILEKVEEIEPLSH